MGYGIQGAIFKAQHFAHNLETNIILKIDFEMPSTPLTAKCAYWHLKAWNQIAVLGSRGVYKARRM